MKKLILTFALALGFSFAVLADYQVPTPTNPLAGTTNNVALDSTNTYTKTFTAVHGQYIGFSGSFSGTATSTNAVTFVFSPGLLNNTTNFSNVASDYTRVTYTANGTNPVYFSTNIFVGANGWLRLIAVENHCTNTAAYITNLLVRGSIKY